MANNNAIGFALEIPDSVFEQIKKAQDAIVQLEEQARTSADKINKSFMSIGSGGLQNFIQKLGEAKASMLAFDGTSSAGMKDFAANIVEAANALNRIGKSGAGAFSGDASDIQKLSKEVSALSESYAKLEKQYSELEKSKSRGTSSTRAAAQAESVYNRAMFATEGTMTQRINKIAKLREAERRLTEAGIATSERLKTIRQETARLNSENEKAAKSTDNLRSKQKSLINTGEQLKRAFALIFSVSQIRGYVTHLAEVRGEFELQNKSLQAILQNKDEADRLFNQITELAVRSPFQLKELVTYTKQLSAYRIESDKLYDTTKMLADVSAGLGVGMDRLILAFGQIKAAGYLRGTEARQLTEAGINVYGELADYYGELEGRIVSVNEVMDRQYKRMISFGDVETIFKRLTESGGIFYNMQEVQADTVTGMISNLRDSIDIMLNEIGKANEGTIKSSLNLVKTLVDNYQILEGIIQSVGVAVAVYAVKAAIAAAANERLAKSGSAAAARLLEIRKAQGITGGIFTKLISGAKSFASFIKSNPILLLASAVSGAAFAIDKYNKSIAEARSQYDILSNSLLKSKDTLNGIVSSIQEQDRLYQDATSSLSQYSEGTEEYSNAASKAASAEKERSKLLEQLKKDFPEVYEQYVQQGEAVSNLVTIQKQYNDELRSTLSLNYLMQQGEGWFDEGIIKDFDDLSAAAKDFESESQKLSGAYDAISRKVEGILVDNERLNKRYGEEIRGILDSNLSDYEKLSKLSAVLTSFSGAQGTLPSTKILALTSEIKNATENADKFNSAYTSAMREAQRETQRLVDTALKDVNGDTEKARKNIEAFVKSLPSMVDKTMQEFINNELKIRLGFTIDFSEPQKEFEGFAKRIREYGEKIGLGKNDLIRVDDTTSQYFDNLNTKVKDNVAEIEKLNAAIGQRPESGLTNQEEIDRLTALNNLYIQLLKYFGEWKETESSAGAGGDDSLQILNKQIALIKEAAKKYEELRKNYNETDAAEMVRKAYEQTAKELGIADIVGEMTFDASGVIAAFEQLSTEGKAALQLALSQAMDGYRAEVDIEARVENREQIKSEIQSLFEGYNLSIELDEMGVGIDRLKAMLKELGATSEEIDLLGLSGNTLQEAIDTVREKIKELRAAGGEEDLKAAKEYQEQLTALELSEARKRFSELASLREKYYSNEQKISGVEADIAKWKAELAAMGESGNEEMRELLKLRIQQGEETILELKSEALQLTEFWRTLFGDLEEISVKSLRGLIDISDEIIKNAVVKTDDKGQQIGYTSSYTEDGRTKQVYLTMAQYNQLIRGAKNAYDEIRDKNPFAALYDAIKEGKKSGEDGLDYIERLDLAMQSSLDVVSQFANNLGTIFGADEDTMETINNAMGIVSGAASSGMGIARIASGDIVGGISQLASGLADIFSSIRGISETSLNETIEREQKNVERLQRSYERLTEAMDNAFSAPSMKANYDAALDNIEQQIDAYEKMIAAERQKKNADEDALDDYRNSMDDLQQQADELRSQYLSNLGGFGSDESMASAAQEFVDAWLDAYRETGDGLDALTEQWNEYIDNVIAKQLMLMGMEKYLEPVFSMLDGYLNDAQFTPEEAAALKEEINKVLPELNEFWKSIMGAFGEIGSGTGQMSGLQRGIQEITETTAQALEALLNSIRFFVADDNATLHNLYRQLFSAEEGANPMLTELRTQTRLLTSIDKRLANVIKGGHNKGGDGIKTFIQ